MTRAGTLHRCGCGCGQVVARRIRGLAPSCYGRAHWRGTHEEYPRANRSRAETAQAALELRARYGEPAWGSGSRVGRRPDSGITWGEVAARLGISKKALEKALTQHRKQSGAGAPQ